jgi:hypothetical protein
MLKVVRSLGFLSTVGFLNLLKDFWMCRGLANINLVALSFMLEFFKNAFDFDVF